MIVWPGTRKQRTEWNTSFVGKTIYGHRKSSSITRKCARVTMTSIWTDYSISSVKF